MTDPVDVLIAARMTELRDLLIQNTATLIRVDRNIPEGEARRGAGVVRQEQDGTVRVFTSRHLLAKGSWAIEVHSVLPDGVRLPVTGPLTRATTDAVPLSDRETPLVALRPEAPLPTELGDAATAIINHDDLRALAIDAAERARTIVLPLYRGPVDRTPTPSVAYAFSAANRDELDRNIDVMFREIASEFALELVADRASNMFEFSLARAHQGHDYYRGASGAPIVDEEGGIVALVASGEEADKYSHGCIFGVGFAAVCRHFADRA